MKLLLLNLTCFLFLFSCSSQSSRPIESLKVKRLSLVDDNGIERVVLDTKSVDVPIFGKIYKRKSPAAGIILYNSKGDETGGIAMLEDGTISFTLDGYKGKDISERVSMYVFPDGSSGILVKDTKNNTRVKLGVDKDNNSFFELLDAKENSKLKGSLGPSGKLEIKK